MEKNVGNDMETCVYRNIYIYMYTYGLAFLTSG